MNVKTVHLSDIFDRCEDIYSSVMIVAKRAKQIIDDRFVPIDENEEVEDSIEFEEQFFKPYLDKPESVALEEFLNGELEWRVSSEEDNKDNSE